MKTWWFFKKTQYADLDDQVKAAENMYIAEDNWLGIHRKARFRNFQNVTNLIYPRVNKINNIPRKDTQPISPGDVVWVYNVFALGQTITSINKALQEFHKNRVILRIYTCDYYDDIDVELGTSSRRDYIIVKRFLDDLSKRTSTQSQYKAKLRASEKYTSPKTNTDTKSSKLGRKFIPITLDTLTSYGQRVISDYCAHKHPHETRAKAIQAMQNPECYNQDYFELKIEKHIDGIGMHKFDNLVREYKDREKALQENANTRSNKGK